MVGGVKGGESICLKLHFQICCELYILTVNECINVCLSHTCNNNEEFVYLVCSHIAVLHNHE